MHFILGLAALGALASGLAVPTSPSSDAAAVDCVALKPGGPLQITPECIDTQYDRPIIDSRVDLKDPAPHHRIKGRFEGTRVDFTIYLPIKSTWEGRFFQHVYPTQNSTAPEREYLFGIDSGAYTVKVSGTIGYRADAAAAKLSRELARDYYDHADGYIYGYIYGGSGGSFQTIGGAENTHGVWDGALALVQAVPASLPNNFCIKALGGLVLDGKSDLVSDAVSPGGAGYPVEGLNDLETSVFEEVTALGIPIKAWEDFDHVARNGTRSRLWEALRTLIIPTFRAYDPSYADDFWSKPGYAGVDDTDLGRLFRSQLVNFNATVLEVHTSPEGVPLAIVIDQAPEKFNPNGLEYHIRGDDGSVKSFWAQLNPDTLEAMIYGESDPAALALLQAGSELNIDNRWWLAVHTCHRHQLPTRDGFYGYDYLRNASGAPLYPQRDVIIAPQVASQTAGGATFTGRSSGKLMVLDTLYDYDALPWHADWYKNVVRGALGDAFDDNYRLYFADNADHYMGPVDKAVQARLVDFTGMWEQHLLDLAAWTEEGIAPPRGTGYSVKSGQVLVPSSACHRRGIQPLVRVKAASDELEDQSDIILTKVGKTVTLDVVAEAPPRTGDVVSVEWDPLGTGDFVAQDLGEPSPRVSLSVGHAFTVPGTYFPVVRVGSHRDGVVSKLFARAYNLARVRVVVA